MRRECASDRQLPFTFTFTSMLTPAFVNLNVDVNVNGFCRSQRTHRSQRSRGGA